MKPRKIDAFSHILPRPFFERLGALLPRYVNSANIRARPALYDLDARFRIMDRYEGYLQVLTLLSPPIEEVATGQAGIDLARLANDSMAELVRRHPDRFVGFAASVMLEDIDASLRETQRAIGELGALGVQVFTNVNGRPLDEPRFEPLFATMAALDKPLWLHPTRPPAVADYRTETTSRYGLFLKLGWPYETAVCMARLVFSGLVQRYPGLPILTHHAGGVLPHLAGRLILHHETPELRAEIGVDERFDEATVWGFFRRFYGDTAFSGAHHPLRCALEFFGSDRLLFGTDMPMGAEGGEMFVRETIAAIEAASAEDAVRAQLFEGNARRVLGVA